MKQLTINRNLNAWDIESKIQSWQNEKLSFTVTRTNYTISAKFENENIKYYCDIEKTPFQVMGLISKTKSYILKNPICNFIPYTEPARIQYARFADSLYEMKLSPGEIVFSNKVTEIDISAAYATEFYNQEIISKEIYQAIMQTPKDERLKILGSIATNKLKYTYENGVQIGRPEIINNPHLRNVWFFICHKIDLVINQVYEEIKNNAIFYYVDGIYFHSENQIEKIVNEIFESHNLKTKTKYFNKIAFANVNDAMKIVIPAKPKNKVFAVPERKIIKFKIIE